MEINHRKEIAKFYSGTMEPEQSLGKSGNRTGISIEKSNLWEIYSLSSDNTLDGCPQFSTKRSGK